MDAAQLAQMRAQLGDFLVDTCKLEERTGPPDDYGGDADNWQLVADDVPCRVIRDKKKASQTTDYGAQESMVNEYRLSVTIVTALGVGQRVTIASTGAVYFITGLVDQWTEAIDSQAYIVREQDT